MTVLLRLSLGISLLCVLVGGTALWSGAGPLPAGPPLRPAHDPFLIPADRARLGDFDVVIPVINDSAEDVRIIGVLEFCGSACFYEEGLPTTIPARGRGEVSTRVAARAPGPVSEELTFFTDHPAQPRFTLRIEGTIPEESSLENTSPSIDP